MSSNVQFFLRAERTAVVEVVWQLGAGVLFSRCFGLEFLVFGVR